MKSNSYAALKDMFFPRISFGTAGLRARMAPGSKYMNELVVIQTSQGLCRYVQQHVPNYKQRGICIGYDGRYNSKTYAELIAAVFLSQGIRVFLFSILVATPLVPYGVTDMRCACGVMVTASHNPKDDNGYKVYWENGAQIIPPHDRGIAREILQNLAPWHAYEIGAAVRANTLCTDPTGTLVDKYFREIQERFCFQYNANATAHKQLRITFTAMHGVGAYFVARAFKCFNLPEYIPVKEQILPDPEFSTVKFPNPEEGKGALALAMKTATAHGSRVILANDPDADRLAVAEFNPAKDDWTIFNGNEIALLFADYVWCNYKASEPSAAKRKEAYMVASTVSSKVLQSMARQEGFQFVDTLTGFKWMGNKAVELTKQGKTFLFAYEVEIGFLIGDLSVDKDGVRTAAVFYELANQLYLRGTSCEQRVAELYKKYGYYCLNPGYFFCDSDEKLDTVFAALRSLHQGSYPRRCGPYEIKSIRDVTYGTDTMQPDGKSVFPAMPEAHMITFRFKNGAVATVRNSGTEPKVKYYVEAVHATDETKAQALADDMTAHLIREFLQPKKFGLVARKSKL
jgi:phosphomannomutase